MKRLLLLLSLAFTFQTTIYSQCPNIDTDNDGVIDCIDPCPAEPSSKIGNLSFESDFIGWTIPQNPSFFSINEDANNTLHGGKSLYVTAPNAANFESHAIYSEAFTLEEGVTYNFKIPAKRIGTTDGDALRWALVDENGAYRHFNNYYNFTTEWTYISFENFTVNFDVHTNNIFRLRLEFGLSTTDMVVDKIEFYKTSQGEDPAYADYDNDGMPDCGSIDVSNHPDYDALVALYNALGGNNWNNNANWLDTTKPISLWHGITETNGRVTGINLTYNNLSGVIPEELLNLTELEVLWIQGANLSGEIPANIGNLSNLRQLILYETYGLTGNIPASITNCNNLEILVLSNNQLEGDIPDLTVLANLNTLYIDNNNFQFGDAEDEFVAYQTKLGSNFVFIPQNFPSIVRDSRVISLGDDVSFNSSSVSGNNNIYNWYLNDELIDTTTHPNITGIDTPNIQIDNVAGNQLGTYQCHVTNSVITGVEIVSGQLNIGLSPEFHPDYGALVAVYNNLNGANWFDNRNWLDITKPISSWYGITETNGRVTKIDLGFQNNVSGTIPSEIGNLSELEFLWIQNAYLSGEIPTTIGNLSKLRQLVLYETRGLTGNIPESIKNCTNLEWLYIYRNKIEGTIPDLTGLNNLSVLSIDFNNFQFGDFENEFISYQTKLGNNFIYAPQNRIGEPYSEVVEIGNSTILNTNVSGAQNNYDWYKINADGSEGGFIGSGESINITINTADDYKWFYYYQATSNLVSGLTLRSAYFELGDLPSNYPDYNALVALYNSTNGNNWNNNTNWLDNTKPLSSWHGITLENDRVTKISLSFNNLTGTLPTNLDELSNLAELSMAINNLSGSIPENIGNLNQLEYIFIGSNNFSGQIPNSIWNLTKLKFLSIGSPGQKNLTLSNNSIPTNISNLQDLEGIALDDIPISQPLPTELLNLPKLNSISFSGCGLSGAIPKEFANYEFVTVRNNNFEGTIPSEIINSTGNYRLDILNNYFDFNDLEPLVQANNYQQLYYDRQRTKDAPQNLEFPTGGAITLSIDDTRLNKTKNSKGVGDVYQWFKDNVAINGANSSTYTIANAQETDSGVYYCQITNNLVPDLVITRADITLVIDANLSVDETTKNSFSIYPNPASSIITIKLGNYQEGHATLFDTNGRKILEQKLTTENTVMDIGNLNAGVYLFHIKTKNNSMVKRIIKQ